MPLRYNVIEIFTSEEIRYKGKAAYSAVIDYVRDLKIAARCIVTKAFAGCYENGELVSTNIEVLSFNLPLKIEIILPALEVERVVSAVEEIITDGIVIVRDMDVRLHMTSSRLIPRQIRVNDVMTPSPTCVAVSATVGEIIKLLLHSDFNAIPVIDADSRPVGIITQGDLIARAGMPVRLGLLSGLEGEKTDAYLETISRKTAGDIMSKPVITVSREITLGEAVDEMLKVNYKRMPVVDARGRLVGILARFDIFNSIAQESPDWNSVKSQKMKVGNIHYVADVMRCDPDTVKPDTPVNEIIRIINARKVQRVAVVDDVGRLIGLVSDRVLLGAFANNQAGVWDYLMAKMPFKEMADRHKELIRQTTMKTASDVMKTDVITVRENTRIDEAVRLMAGRGIKRLPVLDAEGKFKGMISRDSVLRAGLKK
ncbi:MAG: histidine kinase [Spirochaetae bacterium HGW-Spirochaetae-1]|jgi:CBS domain-containing protein|nr:MAG: histidine kinase [Spirochaetae bacterium HGW-Spirochaetae-1]